MKVLTRCWTAPVIDPGFAPAKVNLSLHVTGQRSDGYHLLDSVVAFADVGDHVRFDPADTLGLSVEGPMAHGVPVDDRNSVLRAARWLNARGRGRLTLHKSLPAAAGIGGGSSDAAAALRVLSGAWGRDIPPGVEALGADVPVCMAPSAQRMQGLGDRVSPLPGLCPLPAVLVNPGVGVSTPAVFAALATKTNAPMVDDIPALPTPRAAMDWLGTCRNDLEAPALQTAPVIAQVLDALAASGAGLVRMSGSGATCFGLFDTVAAADCAAADLSHNPNWWVVPTVLS